MATVASLQIKIGADVSAAINGLSKAEFAATKVKEAYIEANDATVRGGFAIAGWAQNFSTAINQVQSQLDKIDTSKLDSESKENVSSLQRIVEGAGNVSNQVATMSAAFSGAQAIAGPALANIAALFPALGASIAALSGPIGIAIGLAAALAAGYVAKEGAIRKNISASQELTNSINKEISQAGAMISVLKDGNLNNQKRNDLINQLNDKYGTTLKNIKDEAQFLGQLDTAYKSISESIKNKILLTAAQGDLETLIKQQLQTEGYRDALVNVNSELGNMNKALTDIGASPSQQFNPDTYLGGKQGIIDINEKIKTQEDEIAIKSKQVGDIFSKIFTNKQGGSNDPNKEVLTTSQKLQQVLKDLEKQLSINKVKFQEGLIPEIKPADVAATKSTLEKLFQFDLKDSKVQSAIQKTLLSLRKLEQSPIEIPTTLKTPELKQLKLPDRIKELNAGLPPIKLRVDVPPNILEGVLKGIQIGVTTANALMGTIGAFDNQSFASREATLDNYYEKQKKYIEQSVSDEGLKGKRLETLEKEVAAKKKAIKRDEAAANKRNAIFNSIINTAQAVSSALATGGAAAIPLAILVGALGAAQTAAIAATPLPALQAGGLVSGRNTVVVGEYAGADNNPELISPVNKVKKYITEAVIESGGGGITQLVSYISGDDLVLISERGQYRKNRLG